MSDKPIIFSAPMIRALLDGRKTQTRRILKPQPEPEFIEARVEGDKLSLRPAMLAFGPTHKMLWRLARPADRLWVREAWRTEARYDEHRPSMLIHPDDAKDLRQRVPIVSYEADYGQQPNDGCRGRLRAAIHLPRWASRLTMTVTDMRVQRLQEIGEADAIAEGIVRTPHGNDKQWMDYPEGSNAAGWEKPRESYRSLWNSINGPGAWDANPWVAAYTFSVEQKNIDAEHPPNRLRTQPPHTPRTAHNNFKDLNGRGSRIRT